MSRIIPVLAVAAVVLAGCGTQGAGTGGTGTSSSRERESPSSTSAGATAGENPPYSPGQTPPTSTGSAPTPITSGPDVGISSAVEATGGPLERIAGARTVGPSLLVGFTGGACDIRYRAGVRETTATVTVRVTAVVHTSNCSALGYSRTVRVGLAAPLGSRTLIDAVTHKPVPVVDGSLLLVPAWLPAGYSPSREEPAYDATDPAARASWASTYLHVPTGPTDTADRHCRPGPAVIETVQGFVSARDGTTSPARVGAARATVYRADGPTLTVRWHPPDHPSGWMAEVTAFPGCGGDAMPTLGTLLRVARSMTSPDAASGK